MNNPIIPYRIFSLGDSAITVDFGNRIDENINSEVIERFHQLQKEPLPGTVEVVPAYSSLTIHYDLLALRKRIATGLTVFEWVKHQLEGLLQQPAAQTATEERVIKIPVCYDHEFAMNLQQLAGAKEISVEEVIAIHTAKSYKVFMLGFLPGFAYMGEVDERIEMPRKPQPESIVAGSVGIAGKQTGIYPLASPGGWQIIGRTPVKLFDATSHEPALLKTGDRVQFYAITSNEFYEIQNSSWGKT